MNSSQAAAVLKAAIAGGAKPATSAGRVKARKELLAAQVAVLRQAIASIREKARATPAWAHGYNSAVTTIELQIAELERTS